MDISAVLGRGYLLIGSLVLLGIGLLILSLLINFHVAQSVRDDLRHREKLLEYKRNTFSQLGVILIGIGISLFIFYFQQSYQEHSKRNHEVQQILAKMATRLARGAPAVASLGEFDELLDDGGPYRDPARGGANAAVAAEGGALAAQVERLLLVERDVDIREFEILNLSRDFENSFVINELDTNLWFGIVRDESDVRYAATQLAQNFRDLHDAIGNGPLDAAVADPERHERIRRQVLDIFYDADLLRRYARRLVGRTCWLLSHGSGFMLLRGLDQIEADSESHQEWLDRVEPLLTQLTVGSGNCFALLGYRDAAWTVSGSGG